MAEAIMDVRGLRGLWSVAALLATLSLFSTSHGYYLPGTFPKIYKQDEQMNVKVNSLTSLATELPFSYYSLPFCKPPGGEKKEKENLGELLMGDQIENSPYRFSMRKIQKAVKVCDPADEKPLTKDEASHLQMRIDDLYLVNMILDNLPVTRFKLEEEKGNVSPGYPIGVKKKDSSEYIIFNHLIFKILYHDSEREPATGASAMADDALTTVGLPDPTPGTGTVGFMVVGFEVTYCSIKRTPDPKAAQYTELPAIDCLSQEKQNQLIKEGETIVYTYDVAWEKSEIRWPSRWDAYLKMEGDHVHWFSILNSLMVVCFLAGIVMVILLRTVRRDLTKYEDLDKNADDMADEGGWKLVAYDVFRAPRKPDLLCIFLGSGVQLGGMATVTIFFAALGFMSPSSRGMLLTGMVVLYLLLGIAAGYTASRLWCSITGSADGWKGVTWKVACFFPGIAFAILTLLNAVLWHSESTGAVPFSVFFIIFAIWFGVSVPLTYSGGYIGTLGERITWPVKTNQIPRHIPDQRYPTILLVLGAGILPFGTVFIELFFIMSSIWMHRFYYVFGFLFIVMVLLSVVCAEVSIVLTYVQLCMEDYRWWWKAFLSSGSVALYTFIYAINYLFFDLQTLHGAASVILYVGYMVIFVFAVFLATGTIGFVASFFFVHYLFSSVKLD